MKRIDLGDMIPIDGKIPTKHSDAVRMLERPYIPISDEFFIELDERESNYYYTDGKVLTFGTADGGCVLMPLSGKYAEAVLQEAGRDDLLAEIRANIEKLALAKRVVGVFTDQMYAHHRAAVLDILPPQDANKLNFPSPLGGYTWTGRTGGIAPLQWLNIARAGLGILPEYEDYDLRYEITVACANLARALFHIPGGTDYVVPDHWAEHPMGRLWHLAIVWAYGEKLCTLKEAAEILGTSTSAVHGQIARGNLRVFVNSKAPLKNGRRLVLRSEVEALK